MTSLLKVQNLQKYYGSKGQITRAVDGLSFDILQGEFVGIMGASGSGKTSLLNCIATIDTVTSGQIILEGQDITQLKAKEIATFRREKLGFIFQDYNLLETLSAFDNIALAMSINKQSYTQIKDRIGQLASILQIEDLLNKYPDQLSGGEKQRVAIARAVAMSPRLILADEPTGALDSKSAKQLLTYLTKINQENQRTIMMVTHDAYAASYCERILFIKDGKLFYELLKGNQDQQVFFNRILEVVTLLGGDLNAL